MTIVNRNFKIVDDAVIFTGEIANSEKTKTFSLIKEGSTSSVGTRFLRASNMLIVTFVANGANILARQFDLNDLTEEETRHLISIFLTRCRKKLGI